MHINLKKKYLYFYNYKIKCSIGKNGLTNNKCEGDQKTPKGKFKFTILFYRKDRVPNFQCKIKSKSIKKNMGWCDDPNSKFYNKLIKIKKNLKISHEKLYRKDHKYDFFILIKYNYKNPIKLKGSAIFLHLTKNYLPTKGCIALCEKDFLILAKLINKKTKIKLN